MTSFWDIVGKPVEPPTPAEQLGTVAPVVRLQGPLSERQQRYLDAAMRMEVDRVATAHEGTRNDTLNSAAFNLGTLSTYFGRADVERALTAAGRSAGLTEQEIPKTIAQGWTAGSCKPQRHPPDDETPYGSVLPDGDQPKRRLELTFADAIPLAAVRWGWTHLDQGRIALGTLAIAAGREGTGKSQFAIWMAAHISRGTLPGELYGTPRRVIILATEDSWTQTIGPRLVAAGADRSMIARVDVITETVNGVTISLPSDTGQLEELIVEHQVALVILDPLISMITSSLDSYKSRDMRDALEPLVAMADRTRSMMLGLAHFNKASGTDVLTLISGSHAFRDLPRAVIGFAATPTERVFSQVKNNLGRLDGLPSISYQIEPATVETPDGDAYVSRFVMGGVADQHVADILGAGDEDGDESGARSAAQGFILDYLTTHDLAAPASKVIAAGHQQGYTPDQLKKARQRMRHPQVVSGKTAMSGGWEWRIESSSDD